MRGPLTRLPGEELLSCAAGIVPNHHAEGYDRHCIQFRHGSQAARRNSTP